jgi:peptide/nickel transport system permease protein
MSLTRYAAGRALRSALLVYVVAVGAFVLTRLAPGDFATVSDERSTSADREQRRHRFGLDRPLVEQVAAIAVGALRLDFGPSLLYEGRPVMPMVRERAGNTLVLGLAALLVATGIGLPLGRFTGTQAGLAARFARAASMLVLSTPPLLAALLLAFVAARTRMLPSGGMTSSQSVTGVAQWVDLARHLVLPALALALPLAATLERLQAAAIGEAMRLPFVGASRARGLGEASSIRRHAWPVSLVPVLGVYGVLIGSVLSGAFVVEVVTQWPGLGRLMVDAMVARDAGLVAGCAAAAAAGLAAGTLVADIALAALDPRVRLDGRAA